MLTNAVPHLRKNRPFARSRKKSSFQDWGFGERRNPGFAVSLALDACTLGFSWEWSPLQGSGRDPLGTGTLAAGERRPAKRGRNARRPLSLHFDAPEP